MWIITGPFDGEGAAEVSSLSTFFSITFKLLVNFRRVKAPQGRKIIFSWAEKPASHRIKQESIWFALHVHSWEKYSG